MDASEYTKYTLPEIATPLLSTQESLAAFERLLVEGPRVELRVLVSSLLQVCQEIRVGHSWALFGLLSGSISTQNLEALAFLFQKLGEMSCDAAKSLRDDLREYNDFVEKHAVNEGDIEKYLVCITGVGKDRKGVGFVANFRGRPYVVTCAHVVGDGRPGDFMVQDLSGHRITCLKIYRDKEAGIAILSIPGGWSGIMLDENAWGEVYLQVRDAKIKMFYTIEEMGEHKCRSREGSIISREDNDVRIDIGHVRLGESGSPIFFPLEGYQRFSLIGMLCAREMEIVRNGAQTVGAFMLKLSSIVQVFNTFEESPGRR